MSKTIVMILMAVVIFMAAFGFSSCTRHHHHHHTKVIKVPPGHAKKMTGSKSAKAFAPGQRKKHK